jgi:hypothetical protein
MNKMDDFETSLQVLRGFETDITSEVNDIKVSTCIFLVGRLTTNLHDVLSA